MILFCGYPGVCKAAEASVEMLTEAPAFRHNPPVTNLPAQPLNPGFGAQRQIYGHGVGAIHQPDTSDELEQPYNPTATAPGE
jgi:hypothetical protein